MARKAFIIIGVLVVIGVAIGIIVAVTSSGTNATTKSDTTLDKTSSISANNNVSNADLLGPDATEVSGNGTTGAKVAVKNEPTSDPETAKAAMHLLAIGDWGATQFKPGSCCNKYVKTAPGSLEFKRDYWAQINVAEILSQSAAQNKPERVIGHGDNLYWNGAGAKDIDIRMQKTFEDIYNQPSLQGIKWINVVGNHDVGGSAYICGDYDENFKLCGSTAEMLAALDNKFEMQQKYKSQDDDRWQLRDHYYVESVEKNGVSVDIFNIDTNIAESHGARQICCQCYGYVGSASKDEAEAKLLGRQCNDAQAGDKFCAGGDVGMYNACYDKIKGWHDDSMTKIQADLKKSKATWKIINSHYSPHFHMDEPKMKQWYAITKEYNVQVWMNGHTHGFNHDIGVWGTHFFENGGGGGIQSETSGHPPEIAEKFVKHAWIEGTRAYGFFELHLSKDWMKMEFVTFDSAWVFDDKIEGIKKGGMMKNHCWHVPVTGGEGRACAK